MIIVGAYDAKTRLSQLLEQVSQGEEVLITKRGKSIARLIPEKDAQEQEINSVIERLKELRKGVSLGGDDWKELRDLGRR